MITSITDKSAKIRVGTLAAIIGGVTVIIAALIMAYPVYQGDSKLEIVDITFGTSGDNAAKDISLPSNDTLDIKLRNRGDKTAYIKKAIVHVEKLWEIRTVSLLTSAVFQRGQYDIALPIAPTPYDISKDISQKIDKHDVDRFGVKLCFDKNSPRYNISNDYVAKFYVEFLYDKNKSIRSEILLFACKNGHRYESIGFSDPPLGGIIDDRVLHNSPSIDIAKKDLLETQYAAFSSYWKTASKDIIANNYRFVKEIRELHATKNYQVDKVVDDLEKATEHYSEGKQKIHIYFK